MRHKQFKRKAVSILSAAVVAAFSTSVSAWVSPLDRRYVQGNLDVCDYGSFYVGGVPKVSNYVGGPTAGAPQQITIGQMYVQFLIPKKRRTWPLIIMHGAGYSGSCLEATASGTEGWMPYLVRNNIAVFNVDQPGRARSGFDRTVFHEAEALIGVDNARARTLIPTLGGASDNGIWTSWYGHLIPAGSNIVNGTMIRHGDPGDPDPAETTPASQGHGNYPPAFPIPPVPNSIDHNIAARVGAIGEAPNPVNNTYLALEAYKFAVPNVEDTLPGSTCPVCRPTTVIGQMTWGPRAMAELVERLGGAMISGHSQGGGPMFHTARILKEHGKLHMLKAILIPEGVTNLVDAGLVPSDFDNIPVLALAGDYRTTANRNGNRAAVAAMNASPTNKVVHQQVDLETIGPQFYGTTHMNMIGTNAIEVMDFMLDWASANIKNPPSPTKCQ